MNANDSADNPFTHDGVEAPSWEEGGVVRMEDIEMELKDTENATTEPQNDNATASVGRQHWCQTLAKIYRDYDFLVLLLASVPLAKAFPELGADYLQPQITASWIAVMYIFLISGLSLRTDQFKSAFKQIRFNLLVQIFNFFVLSSIIFGFTRVLITTGVMIPALADGILICACLPMAINMVIILSNTSHGDDGTAVLNSALGNMLGVFLSPLLITGYLGVSGDVDLVNIFYKLAIRVVVPLVVGQVLQKMSKAVSEFVNKYKTQLSKSQMYALLYVVYTVFCESFSNQSNVAIGYFLLVLVLQFLLLIFFTVVAWYVLRFLHRDEPELRVTGLFACTHKTISLGVPIINALYEGSPNLALYILPALMWYPLQLVIGSFLAPKLREFVRRENERLLAGRVVVVGVPDGDDEKYDGSTKDNSEASDPQDESLMTDVEM